MVRDSSLIPMRTCRGVRFLEIDIVRADVSRDGAWTIAGCVDDGTRRGPASGARIAIARARRIVPSIQGVDSVEGFTSTGDTMVALETLSMSRFLTLDPVAWTTTREDGTFEIRGRVEPGSMLVVGSGTDLVQVYEVGRLVE